MNEQPKDVRCFVLDYAIRDGSRVFVSVPATALQDDIADLIAMLEVFRGRAARCWCGDASWCPTCHPGHWTWERIKDGGTDAVWVPDTPECGGGPSA